MEAPTQVSTEYPIAPPLPLASSAREFSVVPSGDHLMQGLYYIHNALRKDLYALEKLFLNTNSMTSDYAKDVLDWYNWVDSQLETHHWHEDHFWFPRYRTSIPNCMDLLSTLNEDHIRVAALQDSIRERLQFFVESNTLIEEDALIGVRKDITSLVDLLVRHLKLEEEFNENQLLPTINKEKQLEWVTEFCDSQKLSAFNLSHAYFLAPCTPAEEKQFVDFFPPTKKAYYKHWGKKKYFKQAPKLYKQAHGFH